MSTQTKTDDTLSNASLMDERLLERAQSDEDGFDVRSETDAQKAFRAIQAAEEKIDQLEASMEEQIQEIKDFYEPRIERQKESIEYLESRIRSFVDSTNTSVSVPAGKAHTTARTKWRWDDRDALVEWAEEHAGDLVEIEKKVSKTDLKSYIKDVWDDIREDDPPIVTREKIESIRCYTT